jgi:hypothetical protein
MTGRLIVVPEGMLEAVWGGSPPYTDDQIKRVEKACRWLSAHPIAPTPEQAQYMYDGFNGPHDETVQHCMTEWQRRMFLAPETEGMLESDNFEGIMSIGIQCGERIHVREELWQVESISTTGKVVTMSRVEPEPELICPVEKALRDARVTVSNDYLCPECEKVHEAIVAPEPGVTSENGICEVGAILRDRGYRVSNLQVGEFLAATVTKQVTSEREVPEAIKDQLISTNCGTAFEFHAAKIANEHMIECYRRGLKARTGEQQ